MGAASRWGYTDTQISCLGGPNFHEINPGRAAYEPNSLAGGCPFQAGTAGFTSFREPLEGDKVRGSGEKFAEHYNQATLFWNSQTPIEKQHIVRGFRFELTKVQVPAIRRRMRGRTCAA